jgi:hypothetical protein
MKLSDRIGESSLDSLKGSSSDNVDCFERHQNICRHFHPGILHTFQILFVARGIRFPSRRPPGKYCKEVNKTVNNSVYFETCEGL